MLLQITIDTTEALNENDKALLRALVSDAPLAAKKATAKKATAKKASDFPTQSERQVADPAPVVHEAPDEAPDEDLKDAAVARASELLSSGQRDRVMTALAKAGADRVSNVTAAALPAFMAALSDD